MSDLQKYIAERKKRDREFAERYEIGYEQSKLGVLLQQALGKTLRLRVA